MIPTFATSLSTLHVAPAPLSCAGDHPWWVAGGAEPITAAAGTTVALPTTVTMRNSFALGTLTREHRITTPFMSGAGGAELADLQALDRVTTSVLIQRLLVPQHTQLRTWLESLRTTAAALARCDGTRAHVLRRGAGMLAELSEVMLEHFEHEERAVFPFLEAGIAPIHELGALHDHHDLIADRLGRLRALTAELSDAPVLEPPIRELFHGVDALDGLASNHRLIERHGLLARYS